MERWLDDMRYDRKAGARVLEIVERAEQTDELVYNRVQLDANQMASLATYILREYANCVV